MEPIEHQYFNWLCAKVTGARNPNHYDLLEILHRTEFVWNVPGDRHRAEEGLELRLDFLRETHQDGDGSWEHQPCSVLELLIALAKRASFQTGIRVKVWFWELMTNLRLDEFRRVDRMGEHIIKDILDAFIWRQYRPDGDGGLFPISRTNSDQRKNEIWYQFCEYVEDRGIL
jgi:hypothetical protein